MDGWMEMFFWGKKGQVSGIFFFLSAKNVLLFGPGIIHACIQAIRVAIDRIKTRVLASKDANAHSKTFLRDALCQGSTCSSLLSHQSSVYSK